MIGLGLGLGWVRVRLWGCGVDWFYGWVGLGLGFGLGWFGVWVGFGIGYGFYGWFGLFRVGLG